MNNNIPHPFIDKKNFISMVEKKIISELLPYELSRKKLLRFERLMWCVSILIFILLYLISREKIDDIGTILLISALPVLYAYRKIHLFVKNKKDNIIPKCFSFLGDLKVGQNVISSSFIKKSMLFDDFNVPEIDEEFSGCFANTTFSLSEEEITKGSGKHKKWVFNGIFIAIRMHKPIHGHTAIFNCSLFDKPFILKLEKVEIEDPEFMKENYIYSSDQIEARFILTPIFIERLKALKMAFNSERVDIAFFDDYALLALHCSKNLFETFTIRRPVTDTRIFDKFYDEMLSLKNLIESLKMDNVNM